MIISHRHRYVFVELTLTGSPAIAKELAELYAGETFLRKHSTYQDFLREADPAWHGYFVFSGIRHPLDQVVSRYSKLQSDHKGKYSGLAKGTAPHARGLHFRILAWFQARRFAFVNEGDASFAAFLRRFYRVPYSDWSVMSHKQFNAVTRFETLAEDFDRVLRAIGIEPVRPLPWRNKTQDKADWQAYFADADVRQHAVRVFGPFMKYWGYEFPADWGRCEPSAGDESMYRLLTGARTLYWRFLRYRF